MLTHTDTNALALCHICRLPGSAAVVFVSRLTDTVKKKTKQHSFFFNVCRTSATANMDVLTRVTVDYETLPGWCCSTEAARSFEELPSQAQKYIRFIEDFLQVPGLLTSTMQPDCNILLLLLFLRLLLLFLLPLLLFIIISTYCG